MLLSIADFSSDEGKAWPAIRTLAKKCRLSERQAQLLVRKLENEKFIRIENGQGPRGVNLYWVEWGVKPITPGGEAHNTGGGLPASPGGVKPIAPDPSLEPSIEPSPLARENHSRAPDPEITLPKVTNADRSALEKTFTEITGLHPPPNKKEAGKRWWTPLREMIQEANGQSDFVLRAAVKQMTKDGLTFDSPASAMKTFRSCLGQRNLSGIKSGAASDPFARLRDMLERQERENNR